MAATFPRFSSLDADHFRDIRFTQRLAALSAELEAAKSLVEHQCLSAIVMVTTVVYLLARVVDSVWVLPFVIPIAALGAASLQHALTLYRHYVRRESLPAMCEGIGRLRHTMGEAPDICLDRMVRAGLLPAHGLAAIDDAIFGDYRSHHLSLAMVDLFDSQGEAALDHQGGDLFHGVVAAIRWPERPDHLPADELMPLIDGVRQIGCTWFEGHVLLVIPCRQSPFQMGGLFAQPEQLIAELLRAASVMQIPHRLIDFMRDRQELSEGEAPPRENA